MCEKVFFNKDLLKNIISYSGPNIIKKCVYCNLPLSYSVGIVYITKQNEKNFNYIKCKNEYFCNTFCSIAHSRNSIENNYMLILSIFIYSLIPLITALVLIYIF